MWILLYAFIIIVWTNIGVLITILLIKVDKHKGDFIDYLLAVFFWPLIVSYLFFHHSYKLNSIPPFSYIVKFFDSFLDSQSRKKKSHG